MVCSPAIVVKHHTTRGPLPARRSTTQPLRSPSRSRSPFALRPRLDEPPRIPYPPRVLSLSSTPLAALIALVLCSASAIARADEPRLHDGFMARAAIGIGGLGVNEQSSVRPQTGVSGSGLAGELQIGGNVTRHLVLAGALSGLTLLRPTLRAPDGTTSRLNQTQHLFLLAPMVDIFPDPTRGFHVAIGFGGALLRSHDAEDSLANRERRRGIGGSLWLGHEWFIAQQWSMGALVRASIGRLWAVDRFNGDEAAGADRFASLSLGLSAVWH